MINNPMDEKDFEEPKKIPSYTGQLSIELPREDAVLGYTTIKVNNQREYIAVLIDTDIHYADFRQRVLRDILDTVEHDIESGKTTRKSLEATGYFTLIKEVQAALALSFSYPIKSQDALTRKMLIAAAAVLVDILTLLDIQEDEAQSIHSEELLLAREDEDA